MASLSALRRDSSSLLRKTPTISSSSSPSSFSRISSRHRYSSALFNQLVPDLAVRPSVQFRTTITSPSGSGSSRPRWANAAATAELDNTVMIDGCDFEHWLVIMRFPEDPKPSEQEMVDTYINTLAAVVGGKEEAKKKIYSVSTTTYTGFGALVSRELSKNLKGLPGVLWVLPDSYLDVPSKDYGGDLLVDGKVVPRPEYRFGKGEPGETMEYDCSDMEEREECEDHEKGTGDSEKSVLLFERLRETIEHLKQSESEDLEGTKGEPTKNVETTTEGRTREDLEGQLPVFDRLRETMKTMKQEPRREDLEETAALFDGLREKVANAETVPSQQSQTEESEGCVEEGGEEEETAALFDRLREEMKNMPIEPVKDNGEYLDWSDEYYKKVGELKTKMTKEQLDAMKVQIQEFKRELMQHKAEDEDR